MTYNMSLFVTDLIKYLFLIVCEGNQWFMIFFFAIYINSMFVCSYFSLYYEAHRKMLKGTRVIDPSIIAEHFTDRRLNNRASNMRTRLTFIRTGKFYSHQLLGYGMILGHLPFFPSSYTMVSIRPRFTPSVHQNTLPTASPSPPTYRWYKNKTFTNFLRG